MTIKQALAWGVKKLNKKSHYLNRVLNNDFLDTEILLGEAIKKSKEFLYTYPEKKPTPAQVIKYKEFITRRAKGEPVAYIVGKKEFYGRKFIVSSDVLIPRPETELLIDIASSVIERSVLTTRQSHKSYPTIMDIGTGSGAIAITLKKMFPKAKVFGTEISPGAIKIANKNAKCLNANITIKKCDILNVQSPTLNIVNLAKKSKNLVITANLPYLSEKEWNQTQPEIKKYEPRGALVGGKGGLELYEKLFKWLKNHLTIDKVGPCNYLQDPALSLIIEIGADQKPQITKLLKKYLEPIKIEGFKDLNGKWRVVRCTFRKA